jgi:chromosome segregation ATPase
MSGYDMLVSSLEQAENAFYLCLLRYRRCTEELESNQKALVGLKNQVEILKRQLKNMKGDEAVNIKEYKRLQDRIQKSMDEVEMIDATVDSLNREVVSAQKKMEDAEHFAINAKKKVEERGRLYEFKANQD